MNTLLSMWKNYQPFAILYRTKWETMNRPCKFDLQLHVTRNVYYGSDYPLEYEQ